MTQDASRPPRDKRPSAWMQDFEVSQTKKKPSPELRAKPGLPPRPPSRVDATEKSLQGEEATEDSDQVLLIPTQEEEEHSKKPSQDALDAIEQKELEEEIKKTPGLAGLVELATTPVGTPLNLAAQPGQAPPALDLSNDLPDSERRVTIWNPYEKRKLSGNSAPFKKNLEDYLKKHPDWEEYWGQDLDENGRKLFPRKRRRTSAEPSPAISAKTAPDKGGLSMMDGLLKLATEEVKGEASPRALGSLVEQRQIHQVAGIGNSSLLGSVLDSVHSKVTAEFIKQPPEARGEPGATVSAVLMTLVH